MSLATSDHVRDLSLCQRYSTHHHAPRAPRLGSSGNRDQIPDHTELDDCHLPGRRRLKPALLVLCERPGRILVIGPLAVPVNVLGIGSWVHAILDPAPDLNPVGVGGVIAAPRAKSLRGVVVVADSASHAVSTQCGISG